MALAESPSPISRTTNMVKPGGCLTLAVVKAKLEKNQVAISSEIQASLSPIYLAIDDVCNKTDSYKHYLVDMEASLSDHSDRLTSLEELVAALQTNNVTLAERVEDLENLSRCNNLHVIGLPEGCEGRAITTFLSTFVVDPLQDENFDDIH